MADSLANVGRKRRHHCICRCGGLRDNRSTLGLLPDDTAAETSASCGSSAKARYISPIAAGLGVSARWLDGLRFQSRGLSGDLYEPDDPFHRCINQPTMAAAKPATISTT